MKRTLGLLGALGTILAGVTALTAWQPETGPVIASSHREAPLISADPQADGTDLYAFVSPDKPDFVTFIMSYNPLQAPDGGPNFYGFGDDVLYKLHIDTNGDAEEDITYEWRFNTVVENKWGTFLYTTGPVNSITDKTLNVKQFYSVTRIDRGMPPRVLIENVPVAPPNIGKRSFPDYDRVAAQAIREVPNTGGAMIFAGQTDDAFWVDLAIFDLLGLGRKVDSLAGFNVSTIALQAPISRFTNNRMLPTGPNDPNAVIGVWMTAWRQSMRVLYPDGASLPYGDWVQVSRLGMPLVNEVVVPLQFKDNFNASHPRDDARFLPRVVEPELAGLLNDVLMFPAPRTDRDDLVSVFLTGVDGLNKPANVTGAEMLRLNLGIKPTAPAGKGNRMGVLAMDTAGFPNGRRLEDDTVDIALQVVGGILKGVSGASALSQGVPTNDKPFRETFPYIAGPWAGNR